MRRILLIAALGALTMLGAREPHGDVWTTNVG
jgi:hypothetical protein